MSVFRALVLVALVATPTVLTAQHAGGAAPAAPTRPREANQFDFLIGKWNLSIQVPPPSLAARIHGMPKLVGTWKAARALDGWGIEDEMQITDEAGNPKTLSHYVRVFDAAAARWSVSTLDVYRARFASATAEWKDGQMRQRAEGTDPEGKPVVSRVRFYDITPTTFRFQQDRSSDGGKSWTEGTLKIEAKRIP